MNFGQSAQVSRRADATGGRSRRLLAGFAAIIVAAALDVSATAAAYSRSTEPTMTESPLWDAAQSSLCDEAIRHAEQVHHLPPGLLASMAKVESGRPIGTNGEVRPWPWAINADGQGLFPESKGAAVVWVEQQEAHHRYIDVGCLQVDLILHRDGFSSVEQAFEPTSNVEFAAHYLLNLYRGGAGRNRDVAVGLYHSHTAMLSAD